MKKWIYWIGYGCFVCAAFYVILKDILTVKSGGMFLFGVIWIWRSIALSLKIETSYAQKFSRRDQIILSVIDSCMGFSWVALSLTEYSQKLLPILLVSAPFIVASYFLFRRYRGKETERESGKGDFL